MPALVCVPATAGVPDPGVSRLGRATVAVAAYLLCYGSWHLWHWGPAGAQTLMADLFFVPLDVAALVAAYLASRRCAAAPRLRRAWRLLALAAASYMAGDVVYTIYDQLGISPYPSLADVCYLAFYPLVLAGLLCFPSGRLDRGARRRLAIDLAVASLGASTVIVYVLLGPAALQAGATRLQTAFSVAYPVGDIVLLVGLAAVVMRGSAPSSRPALYVFAGGLALFVLGDLAYGYLALQGTLQVGGPSDLAYAFAVCCFALAAVAQRTPAVPEQVEPDREWGSWLPYVAIGFAFAVLIFSDRNAGFFPGLLLLLIACGVVGLVMLRQLLGHSDLLRAQRELSHRALHDDLTGLPHRTLLLDRLDQALARRLRVGVHVAVLLLDVDDFKLVNDSHGHSAGDELLVSLAGRLREIVRSGETIARLHGDEFCLIAEGRFSEPVVLAALAERVLAVFARPFSIAGQPHALRGSLGIALTNGTPAAAADLLRDADTAMYRAKASGSCGYSLFDADVRAGLLRRVELRQALEVALGDGMLDLDYQTIAAADGSPFAVEALARFADGRLGPILPEEFIPLAERQGLIVPLGRVVRHIALAQLALWRAADPTCLPGGLFVNVSAKELVEDGFTVRLAAQLDEHGLHPSDLAIELTEQALIDPQEHATAQTLATLDTLGVRLVLDDFGTGYSALSALERLPLHALKIDRSFVANIRRPDAAAPVPRAIVALGHALGLLVIGEGVETGAQRDFLAALGCDFLQGYLLGRPEAAGRRPPGSIGISSPAVRVYAAGAGLS